MPLQRRFGGWEFISLSPESLVPSKYKTVPRSPQFLFREGFGGLLCEASFFEVPPASPLTGPAPTEAYRSSSHITFDRLGFERPASKLNPYPLDRPDPEKAVSKLDPYPLDRPPRTGRIKARPNLFWTDWPPKGASSREVSSREASLVKG